MSEDCSFEEELLLKEYEMLRQLMEKHDTQIVYLRGFLFASLGVLAGIFFGTSNNNNVLIIMIILVMFFGINESFIQYWKAKAVCRFKYLEYMMEIQFSYPGGIRGPHMRLSRRENKGIIETKYENRDENLRKMEEKLLSNKDFRYFDEKSFVQKICYLRRYFWFFYLPIFAILLGWYILSHISNCF